MYKKTCFKIVLFSQKKIILTKNFFLTKKLFHRGKKFTQKMSTKNCFSLQKQLFFSLKNYFHQHKFVLKIAFLQKNIFHLNTFTSKNFFNHKTFLHTFFPPKTCFIKNFFTKSFVHQNHFYQTKSTNFSFTKYFSQFFFCNKLFLPTQLKV